MIIELLHFVPPYLDALTVSRFRGGLALMLQFLVASLDAGASILGMPEGY